MITPLDIEKKKFKSAFSGYNRKEVDTFLNETASALAMVLEKNRDLEARVTELVKVQNDYRNMEEDLKHTLLTAQKLQATIQETAQTNAETLLKETEMKCEKMKQDAGRELEELRTVTSQLKAKKVKIVNTLKSILKEQYAMVESLAADKSEESEQV